ncbi:hypothetical protein H012_gp602 [Acanthamoeba polyphaga moumouvirus]|uniref:Uncharacterized protein n=1 Tax=Acanthamoeba polyphaga moumouvirus TaxID=1269028 RepID=L7RCA7_9VIRU|nr:hypothetical protein H012_gp602 [Acanthamoeba polyphaga moumouvirus]AGC01861.1 hypothetical protein Moumou_00321 [Acanthamoeba polyphaga moumouvirus]AQN68220.1 hypothetical protein [Saudi moumouvirus]
MIKTSYLIIIGAVICLLIIYYFYSEISELKKLYVPTCQKIMNVEAKVSDLDKKSLEFINRKTKYDSKNESPIMSITYHSDMVKKNGNLSIKYDDLTETEANELVKKLNHNTKKFNNDKYQQDENNYAHVTTKPINTIYSDNNIFDSISKDQSETVKVNINEIINNNQLKLGNDNLNSSEYQNIMDGLTTSIEAIKEDSGSEIDEQIIKSISESIKYADIPSDPLSPYSFSEPNKVSSKNNTKNNTKNNVNNPQKKVTTSKPRLGKPGNSKK